MHSGIETGKEIFLIALCIIASLIGPVLWINAKITWNFAASGLLYSLLCLVLSQMLSTFTIIQSKLNLTKKSIMFLGALAGYIPFLSLITYHTRQNPSLILTVHKGEALLNIPIIIGLILVLFLILYIKKKDALEAIYDTGIHFLLPFFFVFLLIPLIPNSEGKVLMGNIAIIYFFTKRILV